MLYPTGDLPVHRRHLLRHVLRLHGAVRWLERRLAGANRSDAKLADNGGEAAPEANPFAVHGSTPKRRREKWQGDRAVRSCAGDGRRTCGAALAADTLADVKKKGVLVAAWKDSLRRSGPWTRAEEVRKGTTSTLSTTIARKLGVKVEYKPVSSANRIGDADGEPHRHPRGGR